jgi:hypothetical protein
MLAGDPVLGMVLVLPAFLIGSGLGALRLPSRTQVYRVFIVLVILLITCWIVLGLLEGVIWKINSGILRTLVPIILFFPVFWFMGKPFPAGLRSLPSTRQIPWAWGINGFASVMAGPMILLITVETGFHFAWIIGIGCYCLAWVSIRQIGNSKGI